MRISIINRIRLDFLIIFLCVSLLALWNYYEVNEIYKISKNLYDHPLKVSNLARDMKNDIANVQIELLKHVDIEEESEYLSVIQGWVIDRQRIIQRGFTTLNERYLGDKSNLEAVYYSYQLWENNVNRYFELSLDNREEEAKKIIQNEIPASSNLFNDRIQKIIDFASAKANEFHDDANKQISKKIFSMVLISILVLILLVLIYLGQIGKILNPIMRMMRLISKVEQGDYSLRTNIRTSDEIGDFSRTFDELLDQLLENKQSLEEKVQKRTEILRQEISTSESKSQELKILASRLELASQIAGIGVWEYDLENQQLHWDKRMLILMGVEESEFPGQFEFWINTICEEDKNRVREEFDNVIQIGSSIVLQFKVTSGSGSIKHIEIHGEVQLDHKNIPLTIFGVARDITDVITARESLSQYNIDLEEKVKSRTKVLEKSQNAMGFLLEDTNSIMAELRQSNYEKERINEELEAFSYSVSHDLRAPLRGIDGFSLAVIEDYGDVLDEHGIRYLNRIRNAAQRMSNLIDNMLKLSRISRKALKLELVDISSISEEIIADLRDLEPERIVEIRIESDINIKGDRDLVKILMGNILENAWKYTSEKDKTIINITSNYCDDTKNKDQNENPIVNITDNGVGFNMKFKSKLFKPFQRLHSGSVFKGSGVGLATCMRIINKHGGKIWATSELGVGSTFSFKL